jgi:hypothetical protein
MDSEFAVLVFSREYRVGVVVYAHYADKIFTTSVSMMEKKANLTSR